jgi:hypothetical protein
MLDPICSTMAATVVSVVAGAATGTQYPPPSEWPLVAGCAGFVITMGLLLLVGLREN